MNLWLVFAVVIISTCSTDGSYIKQESDGSSGKLKSIAFAIDPTLDSGSPPSRRVDNGIDKIVHWLKKNLNGKGGAANAAVAPDKNGGSSMVVSLNVMKYINKFIKSRKFQDLSDDVALNLATVVRAIKDELRNAE